MSTSKFTLAKVLQSGENLEVSKLPPVPLLRLRGIDSQFQFFLLRICPADDAVVIREATKLERLVEDCATDVVV